MQQGALTASDRMQSLRGATPGSMSRPASQLALEDGQADNQDTEDELDLDCRLSKRGPWLHLLFADDAEDDVDGDK